MLEKLIELRERIKKCKKCTFRQQAEGNRKPKETENLNVFEKQLQAIRELANTL